MVSRKKSKGKERKAKRQAEKLEKVAKEMVSKGHVYWQSLVRGVICKRIVTRCDHGFGCIIPDDNHPVSSFMDDFWANWFHEDNMSVLYIGGDAFKRNQEMWKDASYRQMARNIFVCIGTFMLLDKVITVNQRQTSSVDIAQIILILENYDGNDFASTMISHVPAMKARDLNNSGISVDRDLLKFLRKRLACSCLKEMHSEARRTLPKIGSCYNCKVAKQRASLMVCSRCRVAQYCSKQCQGADWSEHEQYCDVMTCIG